MTTSKSVLLLRLLLAFTICAGLLWSQWPPSSTGSAAATLPIKSDSQIKSEAGLFDIAIREISRIADLKLSDPQNSKTAQNILAKYGPSLAYGRSKLIALGLNDSTFVSAVKAKGANKKTLDQFAQELCKDPNSILKLSGASALADRIRNSASTDVARLRRISDLLRQAGADIKTKGHHASHTLTNSTAEPEPAPADLTADQIAMIVVVVAVVAFPPLGVLLVEISEPIVAGVYAAVIVAGAAALVARLIENAATDKGRDRVAECQANVEKKRNDCLTQAKDLPFPINIGAADACWAVWLLDAASCLAA